MGESGLEVATLNESTDPATPSPALPKDRFINRELSWLAFNQRVLEQAADESLPLLERAKFLAITSSNLDEFAMVRVGSLKLKSARESIVRDPAGLTVSQQLEAIGARCRENRISNSPSVATPCCPPAYE